MNRRPFVVHALAVSLLVLASHAAQAAEVKARTRPVPKAASSRTPAQHLVLPFIEDDYPRALEVARQRRIPIFVDSWAPW